MSFLPKHFIPFSSPPWIPKDHNEKNPSEIAFCGSGHGSEWDSSCENMWGSPYVNVLQQLQFVSGDQQLS